MRERSRTSRLYEDLYDHDELRPDPMLAEVAKDLAWLSARDSRTVVRFRYPAGLWLPTRGIHR